METLHARMQADPKVAAAVPDFLGTFKEILARLKERPATVEVDDPPLRQKVRVTVGEFDLVKVTANGLGDVAFLRRLPARIHALAKGDYTWLAEEALKMRRGAVPTNAMTYQMDCASGLSAERRERIAREAPGAVLADVIDFPWPDVCDAWGNPDLGAEFRRNPVSQVPVLFFSGTLDGRTPASNAEEVRAGFPNSHHILVEGMAHGHPAMFAELGDVMLAFLRGQSPVMKEARLPFAFDPVP
jgi:pimeloyl-ACP methyl ester carboxylesterase